MSPLPPAKLNSSFGTRFDPHAPRIGIALSLASPVFSEYQGVCGDVYHRLSPRTTRKLATFTADEVVTLSKTGYVGLVFN